jgi:competence protein ComEC
MSPSRILFYFCLSFILGIFLESILDSPQIILWGVLFLPIIFIASRKADILGFCILFFAIGILRVQITEFNIENNELRKLNGTNVIFQGVIINEPDVRDTYQKLKVKIKDSIVLINADLYQKYEYLDIIKVSGKLETPQEFEDFNYKNYLMKDGIYLVMGFPKIENLGQKDRRPTSIFFEGVLWLKQKTRQSIQYSFNPPESSILEGTVLGDNAAMSDELKNNLNTTGLRHIIAVSGTHVVILSSIIMSLLLMLGLRRGNAFYFAVVIICFYVVFTGLSASGVRAGIMGFLYLLAQKLGRQSLGVRVVAIAAAVMLAQNPLLLAFDVGFQLSFLAVLGLIFLEPAFAVLLNIFAKDKLKEFIKIISATFAAQVFTLPILLYDFGNISLVSPITNLLVGPVVYWLMIFGFLSSFVGIFSNWFGWVLAIPCYFLLQYFLWVIDFFSQPWAIKTFENVHWIWLIILYCGVIALTRYLSKKTSHLF